LESPQTPSKRECTTRGAGWQSYSNKRESMASEPTSSQRESVALRAAIKRSPIVLRLTERFLLARAWASVRKSPDVDAYVLAWIASHVRGGRPRSGCG
jgi:hypothetical protein